MGNEKKPQTKIGYGHKPNPNPASGGAKSTASPSEALPVYSAKQQILSTFDRHDTIIVQGETGSGKTTRITHNVCRLFLYLFRNPKIYL